MHRGADLGIQLSLVHLKMPRTPIQQVRSWIGTWNGCDPDADYGEWMSRCYEGGQVKYITGQLERGESGNVHLQYIVQFTTAKRLNGVRAAVNDQTHWEPIYGSIAQARAYVTKEATRIDGPWEYGQIAASGKRRGYDEAVDAVMQGTPLQRVAQEFPGIWVAHGRGLVDLRKQLGLTPTAAPSGPRARRCGSSGPQRHREVPLRSEALAQGVLEVPRG